MSQDYGMTWRIIFDLGTDCVTNQAHVHGVAYDPWWQAVWVVNGDTALNRNMRVSFDPFDATPVWNVVAGANANQFVGILPMAKAIIFTTDGLPSGIYTIPRTANKTITTPTIVVTLDNTTDEAYIGGQPFLSPTGLALLPFITGGGFPGTLIATNDAVNFATLWTDTITYGASHGLQTMVGPTNNNLLLGGYLFDGRQSDSSTIDMNQVFTAIGNGIAISKGAAVQ